MENITVVDVGSHTLKAGLPYNFPSFGDPTVVTPTCVTPVADPALPDGGEDAALHSVLDRGLVANWEGLEALLYGVLYGELGWVAGEEGYLLMSEPLFQPKADRERLAQMLFERFNLNGLFLADQAVLSLYAVGKTTGLVIDLGHGKADICPVVEGQLYHPATRRLHYGGQDLTQHLQRLLRRRDGDGAAAGSLSAAELERVKEDCMRVAQSAEAAESEEVEAVEHALPGGRTVSIGREGLQLGEALLDARLMGLDEPPLAEIACAAAMAHPDPLTRKALLENMLVCGGGSGAQGTGIRLLREVAALAPSSAQPALVQVPEYMPEHTLRAAAWMGGAVLSKIVFGQNHHVSKYEYDEVGPAVVHRKCFA